MIPFLDLKKQYNAIKREIDDAIFKVISEASFVGGEFVDHFESCFAEYVNAKHCICVGNGTDALEIAIEALDLPPNSEIIVPANSFIASSEAVTRNGHKVVFADCDPESYIIDPKDILRRVTSKTRAIMAVHLYGHPCNMDALGEIAKLHSLAIIEDCAQAHGAKFNGQTVGSIGNIATFSFYPGKNLGAYGDGGAITTNDEKIAIRCRMIANHGRLAKYDHLFEGRNSRLDGIQAAVLSVKLNHLPKWNKQRVLLAERYLSELKNVGQVTLPKRQDWAYQVYHLFVIRVEKRDGLQTFLNSRGIQTGIHYPISLPKLLAYDYLKQADDDLYANDFDSKLLSLPIGEHLSEEQVLDVVDRIKEFYHE